MLRLFARRRRPTKFEFEEARSWVESKMWTPKELVKRLPSQLVVKQSDTVRRFMYSERERRDRLSTRSEFDDVSLREMSASDFIESIENQSLSSSQYYYYWTSDDAFDDHTRDELSHAFRDVRRRNECEDKGLLAPSIWIGGLGTCTQAHFDVLDNIFVQLHGEKRFYLWPPNDVVNLHFFPDAHARSRKSQVSNVIFPTPKDLERFPFLSNLSEPLIYTLRPGDTLYVPSFWVHYVEVISNEASVSINSFNEEITKHAAGEVLSHPSPFRFGPRNQIANVKHQRRLRESLVNDRRDVFNCAAKMLLERFEKKGDDFLNSLYVSRFENLVGNKNVKTSSDTSNTTTTSLSIDENEIDVVSQDLESLFFILSNGTADVKYVQGVMDIVLFHLMEKWALSLFEADDMHVALSRS